MVATKFPGMPFIPARGDGGPRRQTQGIVIHATDNTAPARNEASYAQRRPDGVSAHFYVDGKETIQALPTNRVAYGAMPTANGRTIQLELTGRSNAISAATRKRAAKVVAQLALDYKIPVQKISATDLRNGKKGIVGHSDVSSAWRESDHTDPGAKFPWSTFIAEVKAEQAKLVKPPVPKPAPVPTHTVVKNDTLTSIARKYKTTVAALKKLNPAIAKNPNLIKPGQKIRYK